MDALENVTRLLNAAQDGDENAFSNLFSMVYDELQRLARVVRRGRAGDTMNTTGLVHEAYLKLLPSSGITIENRVHFFRIAARAMRQVLVADARRKGAAKRGGGGVNVTFDEQLANTLSDRPDDVIAVDAALEELGRLNGRQAQVVECRFFAGMTIEETALALGLSEPTVNRDWRTARAWLITKLQTQQ